MGKPLGNKRDMKLAGCKEIKLRDAGIRIIFRITDTFIDILFLGTCARNNSDYERQLHRYVKATLAEQGRLNLYRIVVN